MDAQTQGPVGTLRSGGADIECGWSQATCDEDERKR
jgi:hypothetical protein